MADSTKWTAQDGTLWLHHGSHREPFLVKGVCYSPTPLGMFGGRHRDTGRGPFRDPLAEVNRAIWMRDLPRIRDMGANAIRVYNMDAGNRTATAFLDEAWHKGVQPIYVLLAIAIPEKTFGNTGDTDYYIEQYTLVANAYGSHPAVLGFSLGGEFNTPADDVVRGATRSAAEKAYWERFQKLVQAVRNIVGDSKIITTALKDKLDDEDFLCGAVNNGVKVDAWGFNLYRGNAGFEAAWNHYNASYRSAGPAPPLLVTEFGAPSSEHAGGRVQEAGDPRKKEVCDYLAANWSTIQSRGCGGFIFEWCDEWWKQEEEQTPTSPPEPVTCNFGLTTDKVPDYVGPCCTESSHDGSSVVADYFKETAWWDEEWFGLHSVAAGNPDVLTPRPSYEMFKRSWPDVIVVIYPSGTDRALHWVIVDGESVPEPAQAIPNSFADAEETYGAAGTRYGVVCASREPLSPTSSTTSVFRRVFDGRGWSGPERYFPEASSRIGIARDAVVVARPTGELYFWPAEGGGETRVEGASSRSGVAVADFRGETWCVHQEAGYPGQLLYVSHRAPGGSWSPDKAVDAKRTTATPALAAFEEQLFCAFHGLHDCNIWFTCLERETWSAERKISDSITFKGAPALAVLRNTLYCFYRAHSDDTLRYVTLQRGATAWSGETTIAGTSASGSPVAAVCNRRVRRD